LRRDVEAYASAILVIYKTFRHSSIFGRRGVVSAAAAAAHQATRRRPTYCATTNARTKVPTHRGFLLVEEEPCNNPSSSLDWNQWMEQTRYHQITTRRQVRRRLTTDTEISRMVLVYTYALVVALLSYVLEKVDEGDRLLMGILVLFFGGVFGGMASYAFVLLVAEPLQSTSIVLAYMVVISTFTLIMNVQGRFRFAKLTSNILIFLWLLPLVTVFLISPVHPNEPLVAGLGREVVIVLLSSALGALLHVAITHSSS